MLRSRSFMRLTMRVSLPHLGHAVDFVVSMTFLRSAVFAIFAIQFSPDRNVPPAVTAGVLPGNWEVFSLSNRWTTNESPAKSTQRDQTAAEAMLCTRL